MRIIIFFLLSISLFAQDVITTSKGSAKYNWTAASVTQSLTVTDITLTGKTTLKRNANGNNKYTLRIKYWSGYDGVPDSSLSPTVLERIYVPGDTLFYLATTLQANGRWTESDTAYWAEPIDNFYLVNKDGGKILMKGGTYAVKFKEN